MRGTFVPAGGSNTLRSRTCCTYQTRPDRWAVTPGFLAGIFVGSLRISQIIRGLSLRYPHKIALVGELARTDRRLSSRLRAPAQADRHRRTSEWPAANAYSLQPGSPPTRHRAGSAASRLESRRSQWTARRQPSRASDSWRSPDPRCCLVEQCSGYTSGTYHGFPRPHRPQAPDSAQENPMVRHPRIVSIRPDASRHGDADSARSSAAPARSR